MKSKIRISEQKAKKFLGFFEREIAKPHSVPLGQSIYETTSQDTHSYFFAGTKVS